MGRRRHAATHDQRHRVTAIRDQCLRAIPSSLACVRWFETTPSGRQGLHKTASGYPPVPEITIFKRHRLISNGEPFKVGVGALDMPTTNPLLRLVIAATATPGFPIVVTTLVNVTSRPAACSRKDFDAAPRF